MSGSPTTENDAVVQQNHAKDRFDLLVSSPLLYNFALNTKDPHDRRRMN